MSLRDIVLLWMLAAVWGSSFLFMRYAVVDFGPIALIQVRVTVGALCLLPWMLVLQRQPQNRPLSLSDHRHLAFVGITNSALPFCLITYSTLYLTAGFTSILNATTPLCSALVGWLWLHNRLDRWQVAGLLIALGGAVFLAESKTGLNWNGPTLAVGASLLATLSYGVSANYTKVHLSSIKPLVIVTFSLGYAALALLPLTLLTLPDHMPSTGAWLAGLAMAVFCTSIAYLFFYGLIARVGATKTVTVTFLVPLFGMLWGALFLDESVTLVMIVGCAIILLGTALTLGLLDPLRLYRWLRHKITTSTS
jgi:drug/metabolite transporter (DMT)-like permease